ncbi:IclR family transcriptional regulator [Kribbella sp. NPDC050124]|uniref:IclR family transcriptional regulator n=1 Tax=Kribbella sp. NPDC050124 TaxID=3364114 RepID=UPI0037A02F1F
MESRTPPTDVVGRAVAVLLEIGATAEGVTLTEVARRVGLPASTTHRLANRLADEGLVQFDAARKRYLPGLRLFELGQRAARGLDFAGTAEPVMRKVTAATGEATLMSVLDGNEHVYVHYVDGPEPVGVRSEPGARGPLHATSMGKVLIAFSPDAERERLLAEVDLVRHGPNSVTDREVLRNQVETVRAQGYALVDEEHHAGLRAVAVPIMRPGGSVFAALSTAAPAFRRSLADLEAMVPTLRTAAAELAVRLPAS